MKDLKLRSKIKRKKPKFIRQGWRNLKRLGEKWRAPKGINNKRRERKKQAGRIPAPGYGSPRSVKDFHPSGFEEFIVFNIKDLDKINRERQACRIASEVGKKKRIEIMKKAEELKIKVLNPFKIENKV